MIRSRLVLTIAALLASAAGTASGSAAADNTKLSGSFDFTTYRICTDPIRIVGSYDEMIHTFYDTRGSAVRLSFTGKNLITYVAPFARVNSAKGCIGIGLSALGRTFGSEIHIVGVTGRVVPRRINTNQTAALCPSS